MTNINPDRIRTRKGGFLSLARWLTMAVIAFAWLIADTSRAECPPNGPGCLKRVWDIINPAAPAPTPVLLASEPEFSRRVREFNGNVVVADLQQLREARRVVGKSGLVLLKVSDDVAPGLDSLSASPRQVSVFSDFPETADDVQKIYGGAKAAVDPKARARMRQEAERLRGAARATKPHSIPVAYTQARDMPSEAEVTIAGRIANATVDPTHLVIVVAHVDRGAAQFRDRSSIALADVPSNLWIVGCDTLQHNPKNPALAFSTVGKPDFVKGLRAARTLVSAFKTSESQTKRQALMALQRDKYDFAIGTVSILVGVGFADATDETQVY